MADLLFFVAGYAFGVVLAGSSDARVVARTYRVLADGMPQGWCHIEKRGAR